MKAASPRAIFPAGTASEENAGALARARKPLTWYVPAINPPPPIDKPVLKGIRGVADGITTLGDGNDRRKLKN